MPALQKIYREYHDQGLEIIAVNVADQDTLEKAKAFASEYGLEFLVLYDSKGETSASYSVNSLPTTFFVDPNGTIQEVVVVGPMAEALIRVRVENLFTK